MQIPSKAIGAALLVTLAASTSGAQQRTIGPRFQGWIGCWSAASAADLLSLAGPGLVCITPTADPNVVEVSTIANGKVASMKRLDATGLERPIEATGCTGVQSATWSADERRVYLKSSARCEGMERASSGILAMTARGEWLDIQQVTADGTENLRVVRYRDAGVPATVPVEIASALSERAMATQSARIATGADVGRAAVVEASHSAPVAVVEAWLLERGQVFAINAEELVSLADAGVSPRITDAIVAVSNPTVFAVGHAEGRPMPFNDTTFVGRRIHLYLDPRYEPYGWGYRPYGYGYSPYGYDYRYGYFNGGYGGGYGGPGYGYSSGTPVIIVNGASEPPRGRRVKGQGYVPPSSNPPSPSSGTDNDRARAATSSSGSSSSGSSSSSSSSSSAPRQSDPAPARTAHQKP